MEKLKVCAFGIACGTTWALGLLLLSWIAIFTDHWGMWFIRMFGNVYVGYDASFLGGLIGFVWAFVDAFIGGVVLAYVYNFVNQKCCK